MAAKTQIKKRTAWDAEELINGTPAPCRGLRKQVNVLNMMVLEVFWAQMCTMEVLYIGMQSSGNSCLLELEPHVYLLRYQVPMVSVLSNMLSKSVALDQWPMPHRGGLSDA